jgi:predicted  nucleic acid-binding Zn-ribbon protein
MPTEIIRQQTPEEAELLRKREELAGVRAELADRELELTDFRTQLKSFEGRYLRQVGVLYAEFDEWEARIAELEASLNPAPAAQQHAKQARKQADEAREATHGEASQVQDFRPSADLKRIHPDFAKDDTDRQCRTRQMAKANEAYGRGDAEALQCILDDYQESSESVQGEGIGVELIRIIRQIHQARKNIVTLEEELTRLSSGELSQLRRDTEAARKEGVDLLAQLATKLEGKIAQRRKEHETLVREARAHGR